MGFGQAVQRLSQINWPETFGRDSAKPKSGEERPRSFNPGGAETPEEALAYIRQLSRAGRTDEVVGLLRRNPAFREAWQTLQQFSPPGPEAAAALPGAIPASRLPSPVPDKTALQVTATSEISPDESAASTYLVPASRPSRPLAAARQVYETQQRYYLEGQNRQPRISVIV